MNYDIFIFVLTLALGFTLLIFSLRLGVQYTLALFGGLGVLMAFMVTYPMEIFGWPILLSEALYASFFLGTDIITERFSKEDAKKIIYTMLSGFTGTILFGKLIILLSTGDQANALETFFGPLSITSLVIITVIMFIEQRLDITLFSKIKNWTQDKYLWLRNCLSTISVQTVDILVVYPIFFYPVFGADVWKLMVTAMILKVLMALIDTPLIYWSKKLLDAN